ncbi:type II CAAX endopeptidase family protein [Rhodocytophaga aerolata]|uniref:Type II CAAX endopeptidase family protein n=1 Tax=Rhodocytophaga aerolata TaxID=455078 RepID=A0ABT8RET3_9BACT|nr:type II CAAX endopeptidase family protein [Rhodocytophaga aerolata]MDO1450631.1 type II CAAX endopeptidase family protein [Rhodocytophaga aerolata]
MAHLTKEQTKLIRTEITQRGISHPDLEDDLLDHICSAVEDHMASGDSFELAFALVMSNFQQYELEKVQERTQALVGGTKIYYPNILQSAGLVLLLFILIAMTSLIVNPIIGFHEASLGTYIILIQSLQICICLLLVIAMARHELKERSFAKLDIFSINPFPASILFYIIPIIFLGGIWMQGLESFIPRSDALNALTNRRLAQYAESSIFVFLPLIFLWPLLSEVLFRGIMLKGMLRKYTPTQAIFFSGLFFAISLFNPYSFLHLLISGFFCGWLFYRTNSLLPSYLVLVLAELQHIVYIVWAKPLQHTQLMMWRNLLMNDVFYYSLAGLSFLLTMFLLWRTKKVLDRQPSISEFSLE